MDKSFIPKLNQFSELLKIAHANHAKNIVAIGNALKQFREAVKIEEQQLLQKFEETNIPPKAELVKELETLKEERNCFNVQFQKEIDDTNFILGKLSNHWGGYIEQMGVEFMLSHLKRNYEVITWYQKFKRYITKAKNVEIDLVALNKDTAFIIEVKNQLKPEVISQVLIILDKIREHCPELHSYKIQPVLMCLHVDEQLLRTLNYGGIWIYKYNGIEGPDNKTSWDFCVPNLASDID